MTHIAVIGGGPGGVEAARTAGAAGARVTLIVAGPLGGRAVWQTMLPSKTWLSAAESATLAPERRPDISTILARVEAVKQRWSRQQREALQSLGVEIVEGHAAFESPSTLLVHDDHGHVAGRVEADATIIATGSAPFYPPGLEPDGEWVLAPHQSDRLDPLPRDVVVIGAGAPAIEYVDALSRLGVAVTWLAGQGAMLPFLHQDAVRFLVDTLVERGVRLEQGQLAAAIGREGDGIVVTTTDGTAYRAGKVFVAIGYAPDLVPLNLAAAGLQLTPAGLLATDSFGRTPVPGIYAVGDASRPFSANAAMAEGRVAALHAAGREVSPLRSEAIVWAIYTDPELAQVGTLPMHDARLRTVRVPYQAGLKGHLVPDGDGFVELAYDPEGQIRGGAAVGPQASEILAPVAVAMRLGAALDDLAAFYVGHPTLGELPFIAARLAHGLTSFTRFQLSG